MRQVRMQVVRVHADRGCMRMSVHACSCWTHDRAPMQPTRTTMGMRSLAARKTSSTSKAQRSMCRTSNSLRAAGRVKSLKPHCVSRMPPPPTITAMAVWKPQLRRRRRAVRCTLGAGCPPLPLSPLLPLPLPRRCAREPMPTPSPEGGTTRATAVIRASRSAKRVAPSASAMSTHCPRARITPLRTAPPLPLLRCRFSSRTRASPSERT